MAKLKVLLVALLLLTASVVPLSATEIDGAKNPELIPDQTAFEVFVWFAFLPDNPIEDDKGFVEAYLNGLSLSPDDKEAVRSTVQDLGHKLLDIANQISSASSLDAANRLQSDKEQLIQAGLAKHAVILDSWIQQMKSSVKVETGE
jgi:hypothetical protein